MKKFLIILVAMSAVTFTNACKAQLSNDPEQTALNFMNALIALDYKTAGELKSPEMDEYWQGIVEYCKAVENGKDYESSYDLDKLRRYKYEEGCKLVVFKVETFDSEDKTEKTVWVYNRDASGEDHDSGRVFLIQDGSSWKVTGYKF
jgi:hypothetical protein